MKLEEFIKSEGMTKSAWAKKHGLSQPVITRFLRGERGLSLRIALKIQEITKGMVRVDELCKGNGD